jgi:hypothetical protein
MQALRHHHRHRWSRGTISVPLHGPVLRDKRISEEVNPAPASLTTRILLAHSEISTMHVRQALETRLVSILAPAKMNVPAVLMKRIHHHG